MRRWRYTDKELIEILKRLAKRLGRSPSLKDLYKRKSLPAPITYFKHFKSWNNALNKAGLKINFVWGYKKEELLICLKKIAREKNRPPMIKDVEGNPNYPDRSVFERCFGSWNNSLKAAGLEVRYITKKRSKKELIDELKRKAKEIGRTPSIRDMDKDRSVPAKNTYRKHFGSWTKAIRTAGLQVKRFYTRKELITLLKKFAKELNRTPTTGDIKNKKGFPSKIVFQRCFGGLTKAALLAGLEPNFGCNNKVWKDWQDHCEEMAKALYGSIATQMNSEVGIPDIFVPKLNKFIEAKTCGYREFKKQAERYCKNGNDLELWIIFKGKSEVKHPKVRYKYAEELAEEMSKIGRKDLARKCHKFIKNLL